MEIKTKLLEVLKAADYSTEIVFDEEHDGFKGMPALIFKDLQGATIGVCALDQWAINEPYFRAICNPDLLTAHNGPALYGIFSFSDVDEKRN